MKNRSEVARKAAQTRNRRAAGRKAALTKKRRSASREAAATRRKHRENWPESPNAVRGAAFTARNAATASSAQMNRRTDLRGRQGPTAQHVRRETESVPNDEPVATALQRDLIGGISDHTKVNVERDARR